MVPLVSQIVWNLTSCQEAKKTGRSSSQLQGPKERRVINVSLLSTTSNLIREVGPIYVKKWCCSPAQQFGDARFMDGCLLLTDVQCVAQRCGCDTALQRCRGYKSALTENLYQRREQPSSRRTVLSQTAEPLLLHVSIYNTASYIHMYIHYWVASQRNALMHTSILFPKLPPTPANG